MSGWMSEDWWFAPSGTNAYDPYANGVRDRFLVYIEAIGTNLTTNVIANAAAQKHYRIVSKNYQP
jgi:hypothetical protein